MKDQILKIAKVKSEKEFYKKYPTEEAFMKAHGKAFKKAEMGAAMVEKQLKQLTDFGNPPEAQVGQMLNAPAKPLDFKPVSLTDAQDSVMAGQQGLTKEQYIKNQAAAQQDERDARNIAAARGESGGAGKGAGMIGDLMKQFGDSEGGEGGEDISKLGDTLGDFGDAFAYGGRIPRADGGIAGLLGKAKSLLGNVSGTKVGANPTAGGGGFDINNLFGAKPKSTATLNSWTGKVSNPSGSVSKADTAALGFGDSAPTGGIGAGLTQSFGKVAGGINKGLDKLGGAGSVIQSGMDIAKGIGQLKEQKTAMNQAKQDVSLSSLGLQAKNKPVEIEKHNFQRPENQRFTQDQTSPSYGTGYNPLTAADGAQLKGYSNTYNNPYTLYSNLGYEPLNDSDIKQYQNGGKGNDKDKGKILLSRDRMETFSNFVPGVGYREIYQNPNMTQDTSYSYDSPKAMLRLETNGGKPYGYVGGRGGFDSKQSDSVAKYKQLFNDVFGKDVDKSQSATQRLARGRYEYGGDIPTAEFGDYFQDSGQASIGKGIGRTLGKMTGIPGADKVGEVLGMIGGNLAGGAKHANELAGLNSQNEKQLTETAYADMGEGIQGQLGAYTEYGGKLEEGGYLSNDWTPQVITHFGDMTAEDYYKASKEMRTGGHIRENEMFDTDYYPIAENGTAMNGKLKTHWGGEAEDVSYNPYSAGTGITSMLKGNSHSESDGTGKTGIGIGYAEDGAHMPQNVDAEAQRDEPVIEVDQNGTPTAHVAGKIKIPKYVAEHIGDESAAGQTFQKYLGKEIVKREQKANKNIEDGLELINKSNPNNAMELATFMSGKMKFEAGNQILQGLAKIKEDALHWQTAFNETAPEFGYEDSSKFVEDVNKGKLNLKTAMMGTKLTKAETGTEIEGEDGFWDPITHQFVQGSSMITPRGSGLPEIGQKEYDEIKALYDKAEKTKKGTDVKKFQQRYHQLFPEYAKSVIGKDPLTSYAKKNKYDIKDLRGNEDGIFGKRTKQYMAALTKPSATQPAPPPPAINFRPLKPIVPPAEEPYTPPVPGKVKAPWAPMLDQALDFFGRPLQKSLDSRQLAGEMYALATNNLDPVRAQNINPVLLNPYQISLQDQMNANQADFNAISRQVENNPAALASLAAQKYRANSGVLGEEFRTNQGLAANVYNQNRVNLYENAIKNMDIMNNQWMLQEKAKANTKATNIAALTSIADKYSQNASENFQGAIAQNMYPKFRYNDAGKAYVIPSFSSPLIMPTLASKETSDANAKTPGFVDYLKGIGKKKTQTASNGTIVKNFKKF